MLEEETGVFPEASMSTMETEELRQLCAGKKKRYAAFKAGHDTFRDEMHHDSSFCQPGNESDERDQQGRAGGERAKAGSITAGHFAKRRANDQRNGGSHRSGSVARTAKDPEDQPGKQARVKACFRRQVGKGRIA